jgi:hypothetical protein
MCSRVACGRPGACRDVVPGSGKAAQGSTRWLQSLAVSLWLLCPLSSPSSGKIMETFFMMEENHAMRIKNFR